jgi:DNA-directed RNA polymerase subunit P
MIMYKCLKCKKQIKLEQIRDKIRCPFCGYKVIVKERPKTVVKVESR